MTVIACRDGIMAADTAVWLGGIICGHVHKIVRLSDGRLLACSGRSAAAEACRDWLNGKSPKPDPEPEDQFGGLLLCADGPLRIDEKFRLCEAAPAPYAVIGAHAEFMLGAMAAGASSEDAVRLAIQHGDSAGGEVQVARLGDQTFSLRDLEGRGRDLPFLAASPQILPVDIRRLKPGAVNWTR